MGNFDFKAIESKWQKYWDGNKIYRTTNDPGKKKIGRASCRERV